MTKVLNDLFDYGLKIEQDNTKFKFSLDSIILAEYVKINNKTHKILDLCSGNASIPLILSTKTSAHIDAIEIQEDVYNMGISSINYNKLENQITLYNGDVKEIANYLPNGKYDIITCNPPYFKVDNQNYVNDSLSLSLARHEIKINLEDIFQIASSYLGTKGEFYLVHRVSRLDEIIILGSKYHLPVKNVELIKTKNNGVPYIVLVRCIKDAGVGIKVQDTLSIAGLKTYKNLFKERI